VKWLVLLLATTTASAAPTLPGGATIGFDQLLLHENGSAPLVPPAGPDSATRYFNLAHCACSQNFAAGPGYVEQDFAYRLLLQNATTPIHRPLEIWVGAQCDDPTLRPAQCHQVDTITDLSTIPAGGVAPEIPVIDLMEPEPGSLACDFRAITSGEWAIADADGDGVYDYFAGQSIVTDALAPPLPYDFHVTTGPGYFELSWVPPADLSDIAAYQVLCAHADGTPVTSHAPPPPRYVTARQLCGEALDVPLVPSELDLGPVDASGDVALPQEIAQLYPANICADQPDPNATSVRVDGLTGGQQLIVLFLAVDRAGNAAATYLYPTITSRGILTHSSACLIAQAFGDDHPLTRAARVFRDDVLAASALGRAVIAAYYDVSARLPRGRAPWPLVLLALLAYSGLSIGTNRASRPGKRMRSSSASRIGPNTSVAT
jgi:hypothetical protein